jgi:uncharacterized protein (DUF2236 family)
MTATLRLPGLIQRHLESSAASLFTADQERRVDFTQPHGEPALAAASSVSWRVFKNPVSLFMGGVAAVVLELAEPRVCAAIWGQSTFRRDPLRRLRRTGLAAMVTIYGARSVSEPMIARVAQMHGRIAGTTAAGVPYSAADPALVTWVHATAAYGFAEAYHRFVEPLSVHDIDRYFAEGAPAARLYGSPAPPQTAAQVRQLFESTRASLEPSPVIPAFLRLMRETPAFPVPMLGLQGLLVRASLELLPESIRRWLRLADEMELRSYERWAVAAAARAANRLLLMQSPPVQSCLRLGLPARHLYD